MCIVYPIALGSPAMEIVPEGQQLPVENQTVPILATQFYCVDPRDGIANFQFVRPVKVGYGARTAPRETYITLSLGVDPTASPFIERLNLSLTIDHDYVVHVEGHSSGRQDRAERQIHNLEFALSLPMLGDEARAGAAGRQTKEDPGGAVSYLKGSVQLRSNVSNRPNAWDEVPGDIIERWRGHWFDRRSRTATRRQKEEKDYYRNCAQCRRSAYRIAVEGCDSCRLSAQAAPV